MQEINEFKEELELTSTALEEEAQNIVKTSGLLTDNLKKANKIIWRMLAFLWAVMLGLLLAYVAFSPNASFKGESGSYVHQARNTNPASQKALSVSSPALLSGLPPSEYFPKLLNRIRKAQLEKDIELFLSAYSPSFPKIEEKREQTLRIWKTYDFLKIQFLIDDLKQKNARTFLAKVTWNVKAQNLASHEIKRSLKSYRVCFSKGSGQWLIQNIEKLK